MSHPVIRVEGVGKQYVIDGRDRRSETFRELLISSFAAPFERLRRLRGTVAPEERIWALKDVSFTVEEGEVVGIIGRNGAGKSTLLKVLTRITEPTEGRAEIRGRVASLLEVGTGFHPELTGRENIYLNGAILGMKRSEIDRKFDEIVDFSGVETFLDTPVKRYSSGMHVRLAFAVAAHLDTDVLLIDEVLAVGDLEFQKKCLGRMQSVAHEGRTVIFVSHNMNAIRQFCPQSIRFREGRLVSKGSSDTIIQEYLNTHSTKQSSSTSCQELSASQRHLKTSVITDGDGHHTAIIPYERPFIVIITYEAPPFHDFRVGVAVTDQLGNFLFHSWDCDFLPDQRKEFGKLYRETCKIPGRFLRPGHYTLIVELRADSHGTLDFQETVDLELEISEIGFTERWGLIAPLLEWESSSD